MSLSITDTPIRMNNLLGADTRGIDDKGRVAIPSKWRRNLSERIILVKNMGEVTLRDFNEHINYHPASCEEVRLDAQGRIRLPSAMRDLFAKEVLFLGMQTYLALKRDE